jgi:hypothetical protein
LSLIALNMHSNGSRLYSLTFNKGDLSWRTNEGKVAKAVVAVNRAAAAEAAAAVRVAAPVVEAAKAAVAVAVAAVLAEAAASPGDANTKTDLRTSPNKDQ